MALLPAIIVQGVEKLTGLQISIVSPETEIKAREYLASVRKAVKDLKVSVVELKKPFKKEIDDIDALRKPLLMKLKSRDEETERAILAYLRKVREETEKANQKALEKFEKKADAAAVKAIETGKPMPLIIPPAMRTAPPKTVELEGAKQTVVKRKAWRLSPRAANAKLLPETMTALDNQVFECCIPPEYFILDTVRIGKVVRAGGSIPGIEMYEEESLSQRAI